MSSEDKSRQFREQIKEIEKRCLGELMPLIEKLRDETNKRFEF